MNFEEQLENAIRDEAVKHINRFHDYHNQVNIEFQRRTKTVLDPLPKTIKLQEHWKEDKKFNPFYVKGNAKAIAIAIAKKIQDGVYTPNKPIKKTIPKSSGGTRELTIFQIPDAAVSRLFYTRLLIKNKHRFSSFSYAYRNDRNVHFAIQDISVDLTYSARTFIAEFDFSDFFGSISHNFLYSQFTENGFFISTEEQQIIKAFLSFSSKGIPQGTSISLFLANLVCWQLDKSLEKAGLKFARYSDDTVIWSPDYEAICQSFALIDEFSRKAGVAINAQKSGGINLLARSGMASEMAAKDYFEFLGYSVGVDQVSIRQKAELRIKKQVSYLLYKNLIQPLKATPLRGLIIPANNRDPALLSALLQVRRYLYGGLLNQDLVDYLKGRRSRLDFKGVMSFYPLLNDEVQLAHLDGWLLSTIHRTIKKRSELLYKHKFDRRHSFPFSVKRQEILKKYRRRWIFGKALLEVPSFRLIFKALKKGLMDFGIEKVMHPGSVAYDY